MVIRRGTVRVDYLFIRIYHQNMFIPMSITLLIAGMLLLAALLALFDHTALFNRSRAFALSIVFIPMSLQVAYADAEPCPTYERYERIVAAKFAEVEKLDFGDYFLQGAGVSDKAKTAVDGLKDAIIGLRSHLYICSSESCRERATEEIKTCDEIIDKLEFESGYYSVLEVIRTLLIIFGC